MDWVHFLKKAPAAQLVKVFDGWHFSGSPRRGLGFPKKIFSPSFRLSPVNGLLRWVRAFTRLPLWGRAFFRGCGNP